MYECSAFLVSVSVNGSNNELCTGGAHIHMEKSERQKWKDITSCKSPAVGSREVVQSRRRDLQYLQ